MAIRKRARNNSGQFLGDDTNTPAVNEAFESPVVDSCQPLSVDTLAAFMAIEHPDRDRLAIALNLAKQAAETFTGQPVGDTAVHGIRHGVHMLASQLLIQDNLTTTPSGTSIPGVVRYFWKTANARS